ncbi:MAG: hypothetical protein L0H55_15640 [Candidatus Nitrosocosmicus sp.]|nr:hypothetical protein [Candidatus Nitrosocosmicus sp.]
MTLTSDQVEMLVTLMKNCEYYDLTETQSLDLIKSKLSIPIPRSTYYNYKNKLYQDKNFNH